LNEPVGAERLIGDGVGDFGMQSPAGREADRDGPAIAEIVQPEIEMDHVPALFAGLEGFCLASVADVCFIDWSCPEITSWRKENGVVAIAQGLQR
jgi:hypothetical protein